MISKDETAGRDVERVLAELNVVFTRRGRQVRGALVNLQDEARANGWATSLALSEAQGALDAMVWCRSIVMRYIADQETLRGLD